MLAVIFAAGVFTGRWTAPRLPVQFSTAGRGVGTSDMILTRITAELGLTEEQQKLMRPILEDSAEKMSQTPPATRQRVEIFTQMVPRMREVLRSDQYERFDQFVVQTQRRFERQIRRRNSL